MTGYDLNNYFPAKFYHDSVLYVHKKFLPQYKNKLQRNNKAPDIKTTLDKSTQFGDTKSKKLIYRIKGNADSDPVVEKTIRYAKSIAPLTIPPGTDDSSPPEYKITIKKVKKRSMNTSNHKSESTKRTYTKEKSKSILDCFKRDKLKRPCSVMDTVSSSQNNTLDDLNENQSLSCTLSEISEKKHYNEDRHCKRNKQNETQKVAVSESFEAVATEFMNTSSDTKIKIHLMNEKDKNLFCENIQTPVIGALKECIIKLNNENLKVLHCMQTSMEQQTKNIEVILERLTSLEENLDIYKKEKVSTIHTAASNTTKASKLEVLSADIVQLKQILSSDEEELGQIDYLDKKPTDSVEMLKSKDKNFPESRSKKIENLGCGETVPVQLKAQMGFKPERPSRVPARYCWTDTGRND